MALAFSVFLWLQRYCRSIVSCFCHIFTSKHTGDTPQIRSLVDDQIPSGNFIADHIIIGRSGISFRDEGKLKGMKM